LAVGASARSARAHHWRCPQAPLAGTPFHGVNQWPDLPGFKVALLEYFAAAQVIAVKLHRAFALDLGLAPDFFAGYIDRPLIEAGARA
jgi:isopenicillin N synthase-like dioxygenase